MVHIAESTVGRRYAGWFIKNAERAQKVLDDLKNMPLPSGTKNTTGSKEQGANPEATGHTGRGPARSGQKVAWGGVKA